MIINKRREYNYVKTDGFKTWVISCLKKTTPDFRKQRLDDYEIKRVNKLLSWVNRAPMEEVIGIMTKLDFPMFVMGSNMENQGVFGRRKVKKQYGKTKNINLIIDDAATDHFFAIAPREIAKGATMYSQILNGAYYIPNKDVKTSMQLLKKVTRSLFDKSKLDEDYDTFRQFIKFISNFYISKNDYSLTDLDIAIIFYLAVNDDKPLSAHIIYDLFTQHCDEQMVKRSLSRIRRYNYAVWYGKGTFKHTQYTLTEKGWSFIDRKIKQLLSGINFLEIVETESKQKHGRQVEISNVQ